MYSGLLKCTCGNTFYFKTTQDSVLCLNCGDSNDVTSYIDDSENLIKKVPEEGE